MSDVESARAILLDSFTRVRDLVSNLTDGLSAEVAVYRVDDQANTIAWLIWHLTRIQDDHVAHLAGTEQAWAGWRDRYDLPFNRRDTGYGHSASEVAGVRTDPALLAAYHADVHELTARYLERLDADELARVVDTRWNPPVTVSVRLVSVLGDALQHLGQAAYVRGLAERGAKS